MVPIVRLRIGEQVLTARVPSDASQPRAAEESSDSESETDDEDMDSLIAMVALDARKGRRSSQRLAPEAVSSSSLSAPAPSDTDTNPDGEDPDDNLDDDATDTEDAPDWLFDAGEAVSTDTKYTFCPAAHRKQLLKIFTKHYCRHPFFPDRNGTFHTAKQIRYICVHEMYHFCKRRGLREVWAYLWTSWYRPDMWVLWARSSDPIHLSRLRTTMTVENHWKNVKHNHIDFSRRPQVDQTVYILAVYVVRSFYEKAEQLDYDYRSGRGRPLTSFQAAFKAAWKRLESRPTSQRNYGTDVLQWTCKCESMSTHAFHLCKHLVQKAGRPDGAFFRRIHRCRVQPLYRDSFLNNVSVDPGSISDGDDYGPAINSSANSKRGGDEDPPNDRAKKQVNDLMYRPWTPLITLTHLAPLGIIHGCGSI